VLGRAYVLAPMHEEDPESGEDGEWKQVGEDGPGQVAVSFRVEMDAACFQAVLELELCRVGRVIALEPRPAGERDLDSLAVRNEDDLADGGGGIVDALGEVA
jgi:hypothetical protein